MGVEITTLNNAFDELRPDIAILLFSIGLSPFDKSNHLGDQKYFEEVVSKISLACGSDSIVAHFENYNPTLFYKSKDYVALKLEIK